MKIAIVHDELIRRGGAEQVTLLIHKAFPLAPLYTSCYNHKTTYSEFKECNIISSWFGRFVKNEKWLKRLFFPFSIIAMRQVDLTCYDIVFISTTTSAKFVKTRPNSLVIAFCHYPFRLAWFPESYDQVKNSVGIKKLMYNIVIEILKKLDHSAAQRINWFITNTPEIKDIINKCYKPRNEISVFPASIVCDNFYVSDKPREDYYLVVSRFEPYKKIDLVIEAFNKMPEKKLIIIGKGSQKDNCIKIANSNIYFKEGVSMNEIADLYSNCKALVFPQLEDYGLTPIEANASGRPVIAYGKGGVRYTTIPYSDDSKKATSLFFNSQTTDDIISAVKQFEELQFDSTFIRKHAEKFDDKYFIEKIKDFTYAKYEQYR